MSNELLKKIEENTCKICIIGLGQVGLPVALTFCKAGFHVIGHDIDINLLKIINSKKSPFKEDGLEELIRTYNEKNIFTTSKDLHECVSQADIIIICVQTPITTEIKPDLSALENVCNKISEISIKNKLIIIESSIPPFAFEKFILPILSKDLNLGLDFWAVYIPERLLPGNALSEIQKIPRVIGTLDQNSGVLAKNLYSKIISSEIILATPIIAETSKLVENTYRDVNIAFVNEISIICEKYGIDASKVIQVCNSHPRVNMLEPGPGVGGPCIPKDPILLLNPQGLSPIKSDLISSSRKTNDEMPFHVANLVENALRKDDIDISKSTILILGITYKSNVSDTRLSPAKTIISELLSRETKVLVYDPFTKESFGGEKVSNIWDSIAISDALLVVTAHDEFKHLDLKKIKSLMKKPILIDTRRLFDRQKAEQLGINYFSVGYSKN